MGTTLSVTVAAPSRSDGIQAIERAFEAVRRVDNLLSTWRDDSEIARLNHALPGQPVTVSDHLYRVLREASEWSKVTAGAFDPAIGSLVDVWDLRGHGRVPSSPELSAALHASGIDRFTFIDNTRSVSRDNQAAWIDSGGFGKGVALREAYRALASSGITAGFLNFGGQVMAIGVNRQDRDWVVPVAHPSQRTQPALHLQLRNCSASTSSQSERFVTAGRRRLGHVIDPRSGQPVSPWGSVTVVADDPTVADVVSTALLVLGPERGLRWARERDDIAVMFLIEQGTRLERKWNRAMLKFLTSSAISNEEGE